MSESTIPLDLLALTAARRGHFAMESGHHSDLWLDLDDLFAEAQRIHPFVRALASLLQPHRPSVICGPLTGGAFLAQLLARELSVAFAYTERVAGPSSEDLYRARYRLPASSAGRLRGQRVALVDDVISAGSSLAATHAALTAAGAVPVAAGALMVLGSRGSDLLAALHVPVETLARQAYDSWTPRQCPLCEAGIALENVA